MRKVIAPLLASLLVLASAGTVLGAKPDDVWRTSESGSGYDDYWSDVCGFDVWLEYRVSFSGIRLNSTFDAVRTRTGPGGSATSTVHLVFRYPDGFQEIEDPDTGAITLVYREVAKGSFVWTTPEDGVIYRDAGYAAVTWYSTYTEEGEDITFDDEVYHGQMPAGDEDLIALVCAALG
jgi:hypothetical protein